VKVLQAANGANNELVRHADAGKLAGQQFVEQKQFAAIEP